MSLPTEYQEFIALGKYARWLPEEKRRETWEDTVDRYINFMYNQAKMNTNISVSALHELYLELGATCDE